MATLEQELLNDFANSDSEVGEFQDDDARGDDEISQLAKEFGGNNEEDGDGDDLVDEEAEYAAEQQKKQGAPTDTRSATNLLTKLEGVLSQIKETEGRMEQVRQGDSIEENPEYILLKEANDFSTQIESEIVTVHKYICDHYSIRFPYLETLIKNPVDYAKTVAIIKNGPLEDIKAIAQSADNLAGAPLKSILDGPLLMVVSMEATRATGRDLDEKELSIVMGACKTLLDLNKARAILTEYVQSRMSIFAPNLTELIGSLTAAQLINCAGGVTGLAMTPACNLLPFGSNKSSTGGVPTSFGAPNEGFLYYSPILQSVRPDLRKQGLRIVSNKVTLAARVDMVHSSPDGSTGRQFKEDCERRLDKLNEPPPNKGVRALPTPDDKPSRKRGGRKARKAKEATAMTDIRKSQNRMVFGKEEKEASYGDSSKGLGMVGATDTGRLRQQKIDNRTRAKLSKKNPGWGGDTSLGAASSVKGFGQGTNTALGAHGLRTAGVGAGAGTNSIAFTPVQGLELVDPKVRDEMSRKRKADEDRWFKGGTFTQLGGSAQGQANGSSNSKVDSAGFKVPDLPNKRQKTEDNAKDK